MYYTRSVSSKHVIKRSDIINGRGFAAPPKLNIDTYNTKNSDYNQVNYYQNSDYQNYAYDSSDQNNYYHTEPDYYDSYQPSYVPQSDYDKLKLKLSTNDQLRSYINKLKQKLNQYKQINPRHEHLVQMKSHERRTSVDLNRYHDLPSNNNKRFILQVNIFN